MAFEQTGAPIDRRSFLTVLFRPGSGMNEAQSTAGVVVVDQTACSFCGLCADRCPTGALEASDDRDDSSLIFNHSDCDGCGICAQICPEDAIRVKPVLDVPLTLEKSQDVVARSQQALCVECGKPFGTAAMVRKVADRADDAGYGSTLQRIMRLCPACKLSKI